MEAIVTCGFESRASPPGEYSFTNTLIEVLDNWINKRTFSASCLHAEILFQLKLKETKKGREGRKLEWCTTPIHINYTADLKLPGIEFCPRQILQPPEQVPPLEEPTRPSTFMDAMDIDFEDSHTAPSPLSSRRDLVEFRTPHVLVKLGLEQNQGPLDMQQCLRWLESVPFLGKRAKIEAVYPSFSTLIVLSMLISVWDMLPDHPSCTFIGYITGPSSHSESAKAKGLSTEFPEGRLSNPSAAFGPGEVAMAKQFPGPELPSARRWSHRSLASDLTADSGYQDSDEYQPQTYAELMFRSCLKISTKPKPKPPINTPKNLHDRMLDLKNDVPDSVQSTALPTSFATQSLSDAEDLIPTTCSRCRLYKIRCRRETPHSICVSCIAVGNLNCEVFLEFK